jgi:heme/copper-type cytochrome/quinol oxidase subunit 4
LKLKLKSESRTFTSPIIGVVPAGILTLLPLWIAIPKLVLITVRLMKWTFELCSLIE